MSRRSAGHTPQHPLHWLADVTVSGVTVGGACYLWHSRCYTVDSRILTHVTTIHAPMSINRVPAWLEGIENDDDNEEDQGVKLLELDTEPDPAGFAPELPSSTTPSLASLASLASSSARTRSKFPAKRSLHLLTLQKPVRWSSVSPGYLRQRIASAGAAGTDLFDSIRDVANFGRGHLPLELKDILQTELVLRSPENDACFAEQKYRPPADAEREEMCRLGLDSFSQSELRRLSLYEELRALRRVVTSTRAFKMLPRSEAAWNEHVHGPVLDLAMKACRGVGVENVTHARIAKRFVPITRTGRGLPVAGKMIDFVLLLRPEEDYPRSNPSDLRDDGRELAEQLADFMSRFGIKTFNQSTYVPLRASPTGVFIETMVEAEHYGEGQAQLGLWLASWFGRTRDFPCSTPDTERTARDPNTRKPSVSSSAAEPRHTTQGLSRATALPFLPVILVVCEVWELWFAFDLGDRYDVLGHIKMGATDSIDGLYRIQKVLRLLGGWMVGGFREWVDMVLRAAGNPGS